MQILTPMHDSKCKQELETIGPAERINTHRASLLEIDPCVVLVPVLSLNSKSAFSSPLCLGIQKLPSHDQQ